MAIITIGVLEKINLSKIIVYKVANMKMPHYNLTIITSKNTNPSLVKKLEESGLEKPPYIGSIIVLAFSIREEFSQYIHSRTFDLWDLGADAVEVVLFSCLLKILLSKE